MIDKQEAEGRAAREAAGARRIRANSGRLGPVLGLVLALGGCTAVTEMTQSPEEAAAQKPQRLAAEGVKDEFPNLSTVPDEPRPALAPEERDRIVTEMSGERARATFSDPAPMVTAAGRDPLSTSVVISGDGTVTTAEVAGAPLVTAAGGGGQLAAIIFFGHGSAELDGRDRGVLRDLAALHRQRGGRLRIVGHASSRTRNTTPDEHQIANFDMSLARAESVQEALLDLGVAPDALQVEAVGDAEPVYHEFMPSGEAGNRRVEIFLEN